MATTKCRNPFATFCFDIELQTAASRGPMAGWCWWWLVVVWLVSCSVGCFTWLFNRRGEKRKENEERRGKIREIKTKKVQSATESETERHRVPHHSCSCPGHSDDHIAIGHRHTCPSMHLQNHTLPKLAHLPVGALLPKCVGWCVARCLPATTSSMCWCPRVQIHCGVCRHTQSCYRESAAPHTGSGVFGLMSDITYPPQKRPPQT